MNSTSILVEHKDSSHIVEILKSLPENYNVVEADSVEKAFYILSQNREFSCIYIEVCNESSAEIGFLKQLSNIEKLKDVPIIAIVRSNNIGVFEELTEYNVQDVILPSLPARVIAKKLNNILRLNEASVFLHELEYDDLTGLYTRLAFLRNAEKFVENNPNTQFAILATDFANFKFTNSQFGEDKCNEFLAYIGKLLKSITTSGFAGRYGGDQFVAIFEYTDGVDVKFLNHFVEVGLANAPIPHQKAKIGVYAPIDKTIPMITCCDRAFLAIREIKGQYDKDIVFYEDDFQQQLFEEQKILASMEQALKEEQFLVYYQPKHESVSGKIAGCEALVRWEHPEFGFMNPGRFIPLFEKNGFITQLDSFIVKRVCEDIIRWKKENIPIVPVSINISRRDYLEIGWMKKQIEIINSYGVEHSYIHFEVTESLYAEYMDLIIEQVREVQDEHFLIEMDDFGSGYSTLGLLATFPLNVIKLDISFVRHIDTNEVVIENIIKMAHRMGLSVIAEGAETAEQFKILKTLGCDLIQGFCFSKPLCCKDFEEYVKKHELMDLHHIQNTSQKIDNSNSGYSNEYLLRAVTEVGDSIPGGFLTYHADGNHEIISFNKEILKLYECESASEFREFVGNSFEGMVYPYDYKQVNQEIYSQISDTNDINHVKYRIITVKGNIKYIDDYGRFVHTNKYGNIFYVYMNDITEIHEHHLETQKRNEVIQGLSHSFESIYLVDFETNSMSKYAESPKYKTIMDYTRENNFSYDDVVNFLADNYVVEEEREKLKSVALVKNVRKLFEKDEYYSYTFHLCRGDVISLIELAIRKLEDENKGARAVLTFRTVSEDMVNYETERNQLLLNQLEDHKKREVQNAIELKNAYEAADKANKANTIIVSKFAADLTQPISKINEDIEKAQASTSMEEIKNLLNYIGEESEKLALMTSTVKKANLIITGEDDEITLQATDCSKAIEKTLLKVQPIAEQKNITLKTFSDISNPYIVQDIDKTAQVSVNIVTNALKYTLPGGTVTFGLRQHPGKNKDECIMEFTCSDTGIGISEEFLPHIFEPFSREQNEINQQISSSGLGLAITKSILNLVDGKIEITSKKGEGTTVVITQVHKLTTADAVKKI